MIRDNEKEWFKSVAKERKKLQSTGGTSFLQYLMPTGRKLINFGRVIGKDFISFIKVKHKATNSHGVVPVSGRH